MRNLNFFFFWRCQGASSLFNLAAHSVRRPKKRTIRKDGATGGGGRVNFSGKWHICEPEVIINYWPCQGEAFDAGRISGRETGKRGESKGRETLKFGRSFSQTAVMRSLTSWAGLHYSRQTTGHQMKGEWAQVPADWFRITLIAQLPMKGSWAVAHISSEAHCLIGWCLLAFVMRWLRASLSLVPAEHTALEPTLTGLLSGLRCGKGFF